MKVLISKLNMCFFATSYRRDFFRTAGDYVELLTRVKKHIKRNKKGDVAAPSRLSEPIDEIIKSNIASLVNGLLSSQIRNKQSFTEENNNDANSIDNQIHQKEKSVRYTTYDLPLAKVLFLLLHLGLLFSISFQNLAYDADVF